MAPKTGEQLKQRLLMLFVALAVVLVGLTWADALGEPQTQAPAYYRNAAQPAEPTHAIPPVSSEQRQRQHTATPEPGDEVTPTSDRFDVLMDE